MPVPVQAVMVYYFILFSVTLFFFILHLLLLFLLFVILESGTQKFLFLIICLKIFIFHGLKTKCFCLKVLVWFKFWYFLQFGYITIVIFCNFSYITDNFQKGHNVLYYCIIIFWKVITYFIILLYYYYTVLYY